MGEIIGEQETSLEAFLQAWGNYPTGVSVVTSIEPDGSVHGMAANGINSVSLDPLLVLVSVGHNRNSYPLIKDAGRFAINILSGEQRAIASHYASPAERRSADFDVSFTFTESGAAFIDGSIASMDCRTVHEHVEGDHTIFIGAVERIDLNDGEALAYCQGKFGRVMLDG